MNATYSNPHVNVNANTNTHSGTTTHKKPKSARRKSRELAVQGIYQWLLNKSDLASILSTLEGDITFEMQSDMHADAQKPHTPERFDVQHLHRLIEGVLQTHTTLEELINPHLDRSLKELSPIERSALLIGCYELLHCIDIPYKVIINEAVEVTKIFGGVDGYKYVNGVLDKLAPIIRTHEKE